MGFCSGRMSLEIKPKEKTSTFNLWQYSPRSTPSKVFNQHYVELLSLSNVQDSRQFSFIRNGQRSCSFQCNCLIPRVQITQLNFTGKEASCAWCTLTLGKMLNTTIQNYFYIISLCSSTLNLCCM